MAQQHHTIGRLKRAATQGQVNQVRLWKTLSTAHFVENRPMPDRSLMYEEDHFVLLMPGAAEEILTAAELQQRLETILGDRQSDLPRDLAKLPTVEAQATSLMNTACDFELQPGQTMQWFAIRLEK
ncbi:MAG: chlororespiratory reduction protein 7 [Cyanobacteria bacterium P01_D01_bin.115]